MIYMVIKQAEDGRTFETRVPEDQLAEHIASTFLRTNIEILAVIRLP